MAGTGGCRRGDELSLLMEVSGRPNLDPLYTRQEGHSPLEWRVESGYVEENYDEEDDEGHNLHQYEFNNVEDSVELMYRIFAGGTVNLVYQAIHWVLGPLLLARGAPGRNRPAGLLGHGRREGAMARSRANGLRRRSGGFLRPPRDAGPRQARWSAR